jgi:glycosyltransferase involved in cell wall biosynthesis
MKNLLIFSFFPAFVPPKSGGEVRVYNFYFELSRFFNITLLSSGHLNSDPETIWHTNNFVEKRIPKDSVFIEQWQQLLPHAGHGDLSGPCIAASGKFATRLHSEYLDAYFNADVIIHEFPFTIYYDIFRGLDDKPRIYNSHNCEYELYKKLHAASASDEISKLVLAVESELLEFSNLVTYCGENDLPAFEKMMPGALPPSAFIPNGMTKTSVSKSSPDGPIKRAVFIGSGHLPNVEAAEFIVAVLAPACPEIVFDVIGSCLPEGDHGNNVVRHGIVDAKKKSALISAADVAVNPMLSGSGSSLKILDFVAHGVPVLSTPVGVRGFDFQDGRHCILAEAGHFSDRLLRLGTSISLAGIADAAKELSFERYSWTAIANKFRNLVDDLVKTEGEESTPSRWVLALNDYDPFTTVGGGATRLQGLYSAIAEWSDVVVLCFSEGSTIDVARISDRIRCVRVPKTTDHIAELNYFIPRFHISVNDIVAFRHAHRNDMLNAIYDVLRMQARVVVCEHPYMVSLPDRCGDRFVYSSQNFEFGLKRELLHWHPDKHELLNDVRRAERLSVMSSALVVAVSEDDAVHFVRGATGAAPVLVVRNGAAHPMPATFANLDAIRGQIGARSAVFLGSSHMPNVDAAKFITEILAPGCPEIEFHLVGSVCDAVQQVPANVRMWGILSDSMKSAVLQQCAVAINPMFSGSGSNVKLADFIGNGLYVISTLFGVRGYPEVVMAHVAIADRDSFAPVLRHALNDRSIGSAGQRYARQAIFSQHLSMHSLAKQFVERLQSLEKPKKRMLFVTYRFTAPTLGGGEAMLLKLIGAVGESDMFDVDVVAPEVTSIGEFGRFGGSYGFDAEVLAPTGLRNVRYMRFPLDHDAPEIGGPLVAAWHAQCEFEKQLYINAKDSLSKPALVWGWGTPDNDGHGNIGRWGFTECGLHLTDRVTVQICAFAPRAAVIRVLDERGIELLHQEVDGHFDLSFDADAGGVEFYVAIGTDISINDARPLAMYVQHIRIDGVDLNLSEPGVVQTDTDALTGFLQMHQAAQSARNRRDIHLTDIRGPHSPDLERFLEGHIKEYDLVVTHNSVFRPAVAAITSAKAANVPSILIPHAHLDDDFYHFPDLQQCALDADLLLAAPKSACEFYQRIGAKQVHYLPAGINISEDFSSADEAEFRSVYGRTEPFFLVLGRKAGAKGYKHIVSEMAGIGPRTNIRLVLIGPDDDNLPIDSSYASYLGLQPRAVVRGALRACVGLINMSSSESFGMVLLEAWLAGRPVIANTACSAFRDLAVNEDNALLVSRDTLGAAIERLASDNALCERLGAAGKKVAKQYAWESICSEFMAYCVQLATRQRHG